MKTINSIFVILMLLLFTSNSYTQVAINTTGSQANITSILDVSSEAAGVLFPRMVKTQREAIASPATGLLVYQTDGFSGFYYFNGTQWLLLVGSEPLAWSQTWQVYGELYENNPSGTYIDLQTANQYYGFTSASVGNISGTGYITFEDNPLGDRLVIGSQGGGTYLINVSASFVGSNNANMQGAVFVNGIIQPDFRYVATISGNNRHSTSLSGIITFEAGDYISFAFSSQANSDFLDLMYMNISISRISL